MAHAAATPAVLRRVRDPSPARFLLRWGPRLAPHCRTRPCAVPPPFARASGRAVGGVTAAQQKVRRGQPAPCFGAVLFPLWACRAVSSRRGPAAWRGSQILALFFQRGSAAAAQCAALAHALANLLVLGWSMRRARAPRLSLRPAPVPLCAAGQPSAETFPGVSPRAPLARRCSFPSPASAQIVDAPLPNSPTSPPRPLHFGSMPMRVFA